MANYYTGSGYAYFDVAQLQEGLLNYAWASRGKLKKYLENDVCPMLENYMKANHPWRNRTGTAEEGLTADFEEEDGGSTFTIRVYHTAYNDGYPYGQRLEYDYGRRYAILEPTVLTKGGEVINGMRGLLNDVGFYG